MSERMLIFLLTASLSLAACGSSENIRSREVVSCTDLSESYESGCPFGECQETSENHTSCNLYDGFKKMSATRLCEDRETAGYHLKIKQTQSGSKETYRVIVTCHDYLPFFHHCPTDDFEISMEEEDEKPVVNCEEG